MAVSLKEIQAHSNITNLSDVITKTWLAVKPDFRKILGVGLDNVEATVKKVTFSRTDPREGRPEQLDQYDYTNESDLEQSTTFTRKMETTTKVGISVTLGFTHKLAVEMKGSLKGIFEVGGSAEFQISLSATTTLEKSFTQSWEWSLPLRVPPRTKIVATALLKTEYKEPEFTADVEIVANKNNHPHNEPYNKVYVHADTLRGNEWWYWSLQHSVFGAGSPPNFSETKDLNRVLFHAKGKIEGTQGRTVQIVVKQYNLDTGELSGLNVYTLNDATGMFDSVDTTDEGNLLMSKEQDETILEQEGLLKR